MLLGLYTSVMDASLDSIDKIMKEEPTRDEIIAAVNEFASWMRALEGTTMSYYLKSIDSHADRAIEILDAILLQKNK